MLTLNNLRAFGADVDDGMNRCMNNEELFLRLVNMAAEEPNYTILKESLAEGDLKTAFEAAHSLKGFLGNLGLTPLYDAAVELTELLRNPIGDVDYDLPLAKLTKLYDEFTAMCKT